MAHNCRWFVRMWNHFNNVSVVILSPRNSQSPTEIKLVENLTEHYSTITIKIKSCKCKSCLCDKKNCEFNIFSIRIYYSYIWLICCKPYVIFHWPIEITHVYCAYFDPWSLSLGVPLCWSSLLIYFSSWHWHTNQRDNLELFRRALSGFWWRLFLRWASCQVSHAAVFWCKCTL